MAESKRKQIRRAFKERLKGKTNALENVFSNIASATPREGTPTILIYTSKEDVEEIGSAPKKYKRLLELSIEIVAEGSEDPDNADNYLEDILDDIAEQVETELNRDETFGFYTDYRGKKIPLVDTLDLQTVNFRFEGEGNKPIGSLILTYQVTYTEFRPADIEEQDNVGNFKKAVVDYKVGHHDSPPDNVIEATDIINIPD